MLKTRALSAMLWSAIEQIGARGLSTIFMLVFARFLTAEDFGVFAAATLAMGFAAKLAVFGMNTIVVQRPDIDTRALSTAFWVALGIAVVLAGTITVFASQIAVLFGNADIDNLIPVLVIGMVAGAASELMTALLRRNLNMKALAQRTLLANALSGLVATPFILSGFGAWGLVIQSVGGAVLTFAVSLTLLGWPVRLVFDGRIAREMLLFGAPVTGADLLTHYNRESPKFFVGLILGVEALGIFAMAMRIMNLLLQIVGTTLTKVTLPVMSQVNRDNPERMGEIYLRLVRLTGAITLPAFLLVIVLREPIVELLLGPSWLEITPIMAFLCGAGLLTVLNYINGSTLMASGRPQARFWFTLLRAIVGTVLLVIATPFGVAASGAAFLARGLIVEPFQLIFILRHFGKRFGDYFAQLWRSALASAAMFFMALGAEKSLASMPLFVLLPAVGIISLLTVAVTFLLIDKPLIAELRGFVSLRRRAV